MKHDGNKVSSKESNQSVNRSWELHRKDDCRSITQHHSPFGVLVVVKSSSKVAALVLLPSFLFAGS